MDSGISSAHSGVVFVVRTKASECWEARQRWFDGQLADIFSRIEKKVEMNNYEQTDNIRIV